jgi:hypothetical protein
MLDGDGANQLSKMAQPKKFSFQKEAAAPEAMTQVLKIIFSHTADIFEGVVDAIAETYGLDKEEMMEVIKSHPKFTEKILHPVLDGLTSEEYQPPAAKRKFKFKTSDES